jgi:hypothetical protein
VHLVLQLCNQRAPLDSTTTSLHIVLSVSYLVSVLRTANRNQLEECCSYRLYSSILCTRTYLIPGKSERLEMRLETLLIVNRYRSHQRLIGPQTGLVYFFRIDSLHTNKIRRRRVLFSPLWKHVIILPCFIVGIETVSQTFPHQRVDLDTSHERPPTRIDSKE